MLPVELVVTLCTIMTEMEKTFKDLGVSKEILAALNEIGFEKPTEIQEQAIPYLLGGGEDFVGLAQTGTGKTAAFGIPMLDLIDNTSKMVQGLVICPTRELCLQIAKELESFSKHVKGVKVVSVYGGAPIDKQIQKIKKGAQVIVATPGRLQDLIDRGVIKLRATQMVVLDEADEMLNMGFKEDIFAILEHTPEEKKTWLFSATMPQEVAKIRNEFMTKPFEVTIGRKNQAANTVDHSFCIVRRDDKYEALKRILDYHPEVFGLIFCRTKRDTQEVADKLIQDGYDVDALHGDLSQHQRDLVMKKFRNRRIKVLVATDVAARGIDVDNVTHVIHYSIPDDKDAYNHRSGRTGRAGNRGESISIILKKDLQAIRSISKMINKEIKLIQVPSGAASCEKQLFHLVDKIATGVVSSEIDQYLPVIEQQFEHLSKEELLRLFISHEFSELLNYYVDSRDINVSLERDRQREEAKKDPGRLFINLGRKDGLDEEDLEGLICTYGDFTENPVKQVSLMDSYSFINVNESIASEVIAKIHGEEFNSRKITLEFASQKTDDRKSRSRRRDRRNSSGSGFGKPRNRRERGDRGQGGNGNKGSRSRSRRRR